jgi:integrase
MAAPLKPPRLWLRSARGNRKATWFIKDANGCRSTGCPEEDLVGAEEALRRYLDRAALKRAHLPGKGAAPGDLLVANVLAVYGRDKQVARPRDLAYRISALVGYFGHMRITQVNASTCRAYAEHRKSPSMARRELEDLGAAFAHCKKQDMLPPGWEPNIVLPPKPAPRTRWLTREEVIKLLRAAWRYREVQNFCATDRASRQHVARFILVGLYTGSRSSAICNAALTPTIDGRGYVDLENGIFYRLGLGVAETKKRQPTIPIHPRLLSHMRRWRRLGISKTAVIEYAGEPVKSVRKAFARVAADAGLTDVTPHTLRHTAVTWAMKGGAEIWEASGYFGMTPEIITKVYGHFRPDSGAGVMKALSRR